MIIEESAKFQIAEKDMIVYKVVDLSLNKYSKTIQVVSVYRTFFYEFDTLYETTIKESNDFGSFDYKEARDYLYVLGPITRIGSGFHSAVSKKRLFPSMYPILQFIIPKGAEYLKNKSHLLVSNKIILPLNAFNKKVIKEKEFNQL
jgi:hypothetical protein